MKERFWVVQDRELNNRIIAVYPGQRSIDSIFDECPQPFLNISEVDHLTKRMKQVLKEQHDKRRKPDET